MSELAITLPDDLLETIAARVAEILSDRDDGGSPWMTRREAADYLGVPVSRLEKDRTLPFYRWEGRVLYNRHELDAHLLTLREGG